MGAALALLTSPLLGPGSWQPAAAALRARGFSPTVVAHEGPAPSSADAVVAAFVAGLDPDVEWAVIAYSNAGLLAPAVARHRHVRATVYVDARLPEPGIHPMRPAAAIEVLAAMADEYETLPPWGKWWSDDISYLFPSPEVQQACVAEMRRLPLSYFQDLVDGTGWDETPSAYLAFGDGYATERERAAAAGWPTGTIGGAEHLHLLVDPDGVASQIERLLDDLAAG